MTHKEAKTMFDRCRNKDRGYKLANNTRIQKRGLAYAIRLHETDIVIIRPDGAYRINSGGWRTLTTKKRINDNAPCNITQDKGIWSIKNMVFCDRMLIDSDGNIVGKTIPVSDVLKMKSLIDRYCSRFNKLASTACIGTDIGNGQNNRTIVPRPNNTNHVRKFWQAILIANAETQTNQNIFIPWIRMVLRSNTVELWNRVRRDLIACNESEILQSCLRRFMTQRKRIIVDQIVYGNLSI